MFLSVNSLLYAQETVAKGIVYDASNGQTLPFASVLFKGTIIGKETDSNGKFDLHAPTPQDSLEIDVLGYNKKYVKIKPSTINSSLIVMIHPENVNIGEVVVKPTENPSHVILRAINKHRAHNNPDEFNAYNYKKYSKKEYRLINLSDKVRNSVYFRGQKKVFKLLADSSFYLPIYFSEEISNNKYRTKPLYKYSNVIAKKQSSLKFLDDLQLSGYTSNLDAGYNFYDDYINIYDKNFVSPLASNGLFYYRYYIADSSKVNGVKHYTIKYVPKRPQENVFYGTFEVESKFYSIVNLNAHLSPQANLNFIQKLNIKVSYQLIGDSIPFFSRNEVNGVIDYYPGNDTSSARMSLYTGLVNNFDSVQINPSVANTILLNSKVGYEVVKNDDYTRKDTSYWNTHRLEKLSVNDIEAYHTIDTVNNIPLVKQVDLLAQMTLTGYYDVGKFEIGPYLNLLSFNHIEGCRVFFGGRTSEEISEHFLAWGGVGYGFKDRRLKGNLGLGYKFKSPTRKIFQAYFSDDIVRIGGSDRILFLRENKLSPSEDNLISALMNRTIVDQLMLEKRVDISFENEWYTGFSSTVKLSLRNQQSPLYYPFMQRGFAVSSVTGAELSFDQRFSYHEKYLERGMRRLYMSPKYPVVHFLVGLGVTKVGNESHLFSRFHTTIKQHVFFGQTSFNYAIEAGTILGTAPYTYLETPRGNQNYGYYRYNFNLMNNLTYINDTYLQCYSEYHLNGFFLNRIPFFRRLKFREVLTAKAMIGDRNQKNNDYLSMPQSVVSMGGKPYVETGVGLENVFKFFRIDCIWRVLPLARNNESTTAARIGVRGTFSIDF